MNKNIDFTKILRDCPKGWKFYSSVYGDVKFIEIRSIHSDPYMVHNEYSPSDLDVLNYPIIFKANSSIYRVTSAGELIKGVGEGTFFPSKDCRDWSKYSAPWYKKEKFDPKMLKPFDKVLVRDSRSDKWRCQFFSHLLKDDDYFCACIYSSYRYSNCIPYNEDTKSLVGTIEEAPEYYKYWED